ncbi:hypothetical protein BRYFOR_06635 [Marvinbryantia formatexigens DSM 14469]|uniref:Uncharacterized protein n=1 Tax=Marvinbryantia formatexigens DSM 14469 TaxID=478749 RepID=C6LCX7_9FIRM|nr:hypothetical protein [Marvinbryantia formatexigens]EET61460.1 hypothetical protein BRYFOR_06635 [Marvinbryantia formatexigens DSM 14469]UWO26122.1 hypothetical protein NQ534_06550 [Marvinbryantia formatexigens DSM 14469]SDF91660.1 hypothetical protein SAMN05660368_01575 [Marvinbryantia formatexigens]
MFQFGKKNKNLEELLLRLHANASNNYKDAAQENYRQFLTLFEEYKQNGTLKSKQISYYNDINEQLKTEMKNYTHADQKPDIKGLSGIKH